MKLTQEQITLAKENMQFHKDLLEKIKNDPSFDEKSLQNAIFERFKYSDGFIRMAIIFVNTGRKLGYDWPNREYIQDHAATLAIFTEIVNMLQKELDFQLSLPENLAE